MKRKNQIKNLAVGLPKQMHYHENEQMRTGIQKQIVEQVFLSQNGFQKDEVADKKNHGGLDRAVCLYPYEHYARWEQEFGTRLERAAFGENVTVKDMLESSVYIGSTYQLGEAVIQITQGRIPCDTINKRTGIPDLLKRMIETGYTGFLCRVLEAGKVTAEDQLEVITVDPCRISVLYANQTYFHDPSNKEAIEKILAVESLADSWRQKLQKRLSKLS